MNRRLGGALVIAGLAAGYIGVYLCRKNLAVAMPLLQDALHVGREGAGWVVTISTIAYAVGKVTLGPLIDRTDGRLGFLAVLLAVALFGGLSLFAPGIVLLTVVYSLVRFAGAGGWPAMMKIAPTWFGEKRMGFVVALLSLSYVFGGILATLLAREVLARGGGWHAVMAFPSVVLLGILAICALVVRRGPLLPVSKVRVERVAGALGALVRKPQFLVVCALSFTLTLMRDTFGVWSVDFLTTIQTGAKSVTAAALNSTTFDLGGAASILLMGLLWDSVPRRARRWLLCGILAVLGAVVLVLPELARWSPTAAAWSLSLVGLLTYGPYSLLAGALAIEAGGAKLAASASGIIDAVGYTGASLAGVGFGRILDAGGYALGFRCLAGVMAISAVLAVFLADPRDPAVEMTQ